MKEFTDIEKSDIANRENFEVKKAELLKIYKGYAEDLEYAEDNVEEGWINEKREKLALEIKTIASKLREIEKLQNQA